MKIENNPEELTRIQTYNIGMSYGDTGTRPTCTPILE